MRFDVDLADRQTQVIAGLLAVIAVGIIALVTRGGEDGASDDEVALSLQQTIEERGGTPSSVRCTFSESQGFHVCSAVESPRGNDELHVSYELRLDEDDECWHAEVSQLLYSPTGDPPFNVEDVDDYGGPLPTVQGCLSAAGESEADFESCGSHSSPDSPVYAVPFEARGVSCDEADTLLAAIFEQRYPPGYRCAVPSGSTTTCSNSATGAAIRFENPEVP